MVENIRPTDRVGAVCTTTRPRSVKRDPDRRNQRDPQPDEEKRKPDTERRAESISESSPRTDENKSPTGQRIDVVV